ncbi:hypothetical protein H4582DRAFT_2187437 [Lactarius indigo]|nr:hypothetical protein H4582DRAFT_2187437 [Lactarius indigo]
MDDDNNESLSSQPDSFPDGLESDDEALLRPMVTLDVDELTASQLRDSLKNIQIDYQLLVEKYKALKIDRDELAASRRPTNAARAPRGSLSGESKEISHAGGRFSVVGELWVDTATLEVPFPQNFDPLNPARYSPDDPHAEVRGVMAELYLDLAPSLRQLLADRNRKRSFISIFLKQLNQERANSVHLVRTYASHVLEVDSTFFLKTFDRTSAPVLRRLLENPGKPSELYPLWPRLLFPDQDTSSTRPFQCMALVKFLKIILYGPSSIDGSGTGNRAPKAVLWGVKRTTAGMIAMAATLLIYACSQDQSFTRTKGPSGVIWKERFKLYKESIIRFPISYRTELFSWFNGHLFKTDLEAATSSSGTGSLNQGHGGDVEDLLKRLQQAELSEVTCLSSPPAHVAQPMGAADDDPALIPYTQSPSSNGVRGPAPVNDQMGQPPKDANTDTKLMADDHELDIAVRRPKRQSKKKQPPLKSFLQTVALLDQALTILGPCENWGSVLMGMNGNEATRELIRLNATYGRVEKAVDLIEQLAAFQVDGAT